MTIRSRAAHFLHNLAVQESPVKVDAYSAPRKNTRMGAKFLSALKVGLPALMLTASVHAQSPTPDVQMSVDKQPPATLTSLGDAMEATLVRILEDTSADTEREKETEQLVSCFMDKVVDEGLSRIEKGFAGVYFRATAPDILDEMNEWAQETGKDKDLAIAAYCVNPLNWKGQISHWDNKARQAEQMVRDATNARETIVKYHAHEGLERYAAHSATQFRAMQSAAHYQSSGEFDRSLLHQANSRDWVNAVSSIVGGIAQASGSRDTQQTARKLDRTARNGERISRRIGNLDRYSGAGKWNEVGKVIGEVGRTVDLGEAMKFLRPRH